MFTEEEEQLFIKEKVFNDISSTVIIEYNGKIVKLKNNGGFYCNYYEFDYIYRNIMDTINHNNKIPDTKFKCNQTVVDILYDPYNNVLTLLLSFNKQTISLFKKLRVKLSVYFLLKHFNKYIKGR